MLPRLVPWAGALAGALALSSLSLIGLAAKERDDRFCIACHLHEAKFTRFLAARPSDLAGSHYLKKHVACIDCHGGADPVMRLRVWAVAGVDTLRFLIGAYREPERMRLPLRSAECARCHTPILGPSRVTGAGRDEGGGEGRGDAYHAIRDHASVPIACARCHGSHTTDSDAGLLFVSRARVQPICRECHATLGE